MESVNTNIENLTIQEAKTQSLQTGRQASPQDKQEQTEPRSMLMHELAQMHKIEGSKREEIAQKLNLSLEEVDALLNEPGLDQAYQDVLREIALQEDMQEMILEPTLQKFALPKLVEKFTQKYQLKQKAANDILVCMIELPEFKERLSKYKSSLVNKLSGEYVYHNCSDPFTLSKKLKIKMATVSTLQKSSLYIEKRNKRIDLLCQDHKYIGRVFKQALQYKSKKEIIQRTGLCPEAVEKIINDAHFIADLKPTSERYRAHTPEAKGTYALTPRAQ